MFLCKSQKHSYECPLVSPSYTKLKLVQTEKDGRVSRIVQFVEHDCAELNRGVCAEDFSVVNLIAVGAYGNSTPRLLRGSTDFTLIDRFETSHTTANA